VVVLVVVVAVAVTVVMVAAGEMFININTIQQLYMQLHISSSSGSLFIIIKLQDEKIWNQNS
jgi:hypothetical protein